MNRRSTLYRVLLPLLAALWLAGCASTLPQAIREVLATGGDAPIGLESLVATSLATFGAVRSLRGGQAEAVDAAGFLAQALTAGAGPDASPSPGDAGPEVSGG